MCKLDPRTILRVSCLLALGVLLAAPSMAAQTVIAPGIDLFETSQVGGTAVDFANNPLPADFFCPGSAPFKDIVDFKGVPLATKPAGIAGSTDTIVQRLTEGVFNPVTGIASVSVVVRALRLTSVNTIKVFCPAEGSTLWQVDTCLCGGQPTTKLELKVDQSCGCGHANGRLDLKACLRFTRVDTGQVVGPVSQTISLDIKNMPWCPNAGSSDKVVTTSFEVDSNCDGAPDLKVPPTSNFHASRTCDNSALDCWTQFAHLTHCHENYHIPPEDHLHCVNPVCGKRQ